MSIFYNAIIKAVNDYKLLLRKNLPARASAAKIKELGIKRKQLKNINDIELFYISKQIIDDLEKNTLLDKGKCPNYYYGAAEFLQYIKKIFDDFRLENNQVIHVGQKASCALVSAIQLITLRDDIISEDTADKINEHCLFIAKYGNHVQVKMLLEVLQKHEARCNNFFLRLIQHFESRMSELSSSPECSE